MRDNKKILNTWISYSHEKFARSNVRRDKCSNSYSKDFRAFNFSVKPDRYLGFMRHRTQYIITRWYFGINSSFSTLHFIGTLRCFLSIVGRGISRLFRSNFINHFDISTSSTTGSEWESTFDSSKLKQLWLKVKRFRPIKWHENWVDLIIFDEVSKRFNWKINFIVSRNSFFILWLIHSDLYAHFLPIHEYINFIQPVIQTPRPSDHDKLMLNLLHWTAQEDKTSRNCRK